MPNLALLALEASDGTVVLTSITLVFAMLVALCLIITLEGKIFDNINNKKNGCKALSDRRLKWRWMMISSARIRSSSSCLTWCQKTPIYAMR